MIQYPVQTIDLIPFSEFKNQFPKPSGLVAVDWPPLQATYLHLYLSELKCETMIVESHYVDRDFIFETSAFYARSLRNYPNFCSRFHFFTKKISKDDWALLFDPASTVQKRSELAAEFPR